jgi:hypothetical protein
MHSALALCPMHALKEGWLWKQSRRLGSWHRRWYIFKQGILTYVHDPKVGPHTQQPLVQAQVQVSIMQQCCSGCLGVVSAALATDCSNELLEPCSA